MAAVREALARQHDVELARTIKIRDAEVMRLQGLVTALRDGAADKLKNALLGEAREEARRAFDGERLKLQQEVRSFLHLVIHFLLNIGIVGPAAYPDAIPASTQQPLWSSTQLRAAAPCVWISLSACTSNVNNTAAPTIIIITITMVSSLHFSFDLNHKLTKLFNAFQNLSEGT